MFRKNRRYFYRFNRRIKKMLLVKENLEHELRDSIVSQISQSLTLEHDTSISDEVRVHELRKAVKRSRALLRLLKPALDENSFYTLDEILGNSARSIAEHREATVNLRSFINLSSTASHYLPLELRNYILDALTKKINFTYNQSQQNFPNQLHTSLLCLKRVKSKIETTSLHPIDDKNLSAVIKKTYQKTAQLYNDARYSLDTEIIHKWRRFNKHLLFQLKLSPLQTNNNTSNMVVMLEKLSDTLGDEHDLAILENYLRENFELSKEDQQHIHLCISKERSRLQKEAFKLGAKLYS